MATQKRAVNGTHYAFDPRSVLGQAEQVTASANSIAKTADEVWEGASRAAALARPGRRPSSRASPARWTRPPSLAESILDRDRGDAVGLERDGGVDRRAGRQHDRPVVVHRQDRHGDGAVVRRRSRRWPGRPPRCPPPPNRCRPRSPRCPRRSAASAATPRSLATSVEQTLRVAARDGGLDPRRVRQRRRSGRGVGRDGVVDQRDGGVDRRGRRDEREPRDDHRAELVVDRRDGALDPERGAERPADCRCGQRRGVVRDADGEVDRRRSPAWRAAPTRWRGAYRPTRRKAAPRSSARSRASAACARRCRSRRR